MEIQNYKLYLIDHSCGHTEAVRTVEPMSRHEIYQRASEPCRKCQDAQAPAGGATTDPPPVQAKVPGKKSIVNKIRYENTYQELCRMYPGGRVPMDVFADHLGIEPATAYRGVRRYADITTLRTNNRSVFSAEVK